MKITEHSQSDVADPKTPNTHTGIRWWPIVRRLLTLAFFAALIWLLVSQARSIDWQQVKGTLGDYSPARIGAGMVLAVCAFLVYSCYDLFGRHYVGHGIGKRKTMATAFISYGFNLNLGALVGSVGMRYRLYSQLGLGKADIAHVLALSVTTNWLGYLLLAGIVFASGSIEVPFDWKISNLALQWLGIGFIALVLSYLALCRFSRKRSWDLRGQELILPSMRIAIAQFVTASTHWLLIGCIIFVFLSGNIDFFSLFGVLLISAIAGAVTHIPGALGVLEAVFVMLLGNEVPKSQLIAALIAYRAVFYLFPLILTVAAYLYLEMNIAKSKGE
jgi:uncharacterized membrane protein YbhN (UPF0104 family)